MLDSTEHPTPFIAVHIKSVEDKRNYLRQTQIGMAYTEYKVLHITEGGCGTLLLGSSGIPIKKLEAELNKEAADGWQLVFQTIENKRFLLFWSREAVLVTLGR